MSAGKGWQILILPQRANDGWQRTQTLLETVRAFTRPHSKSGEWYQAMLGDVGLAVGHDDARGIFFSEELPADGSYVRLKVNYTMKFPLTVTSSL